MSIPDPDPEVVAEVGYWFFYEFEDAMAYARIDPKAVVVERAEKDDPRWIVVLDAKPLAYLLTAGCRVLWQGTQQPIPKPFDNGAPIPISGLYIP